MIPSGPYGNKFEFITVAAERARQLQRGARARLETAALKAVTIAQLEVLSGAVPFSYGPFPEELPAEPEVAEVTTEAYPGGEAGVGTLEPGA